jgi:hypothetical protein
MDTDTATTPAAPPDAAVPVYSQPRPSDTVEALYDGEPRAIHPNPRSAAKELGRQRAEAGDTEDTDPVIEIAYTDGRPADAEVTVKDAAQDLDTYREETARQARQLLSELTGEPLPDEYQQATAEQQQAAYQQQQQLEQPTATPEQIAEEFRAKASPALRQAVEQEVAAINQQVTSQYQAATQAKVHYEFALSAIVANLTGTNLQEFADINTQADVATRAQQDPARFARLQQHQDRLGAVQNEIARIQSANHQARAAQFEAFVQQQDVLADQLIPELKDPDTKRALQESALQTLHEAGFSDEELGRAWNRGETFHIRDARAQKIIADAAKYRMAQARARTVVAKAAPPVQRPGVAPPRNARAYAEVEALTRQLDQVSGNNALRIAARLQEAKRAARN